MFSRRAILGGASVAALTNVTSFAAVETQDFVSWLQWIAWRVDWSKMDARARQLDWEVTRLRIDPPAPEAELRRIEAAHAVTFPPQLRDLLGRYSSAVHFGWRIPNLMHPFEGLDLPVSGGISKFVWSLDHIDRTAIAAFKNQRDYLAMAGNGEEPNTPEMWEHQFPIASIGEGDFITIDMSSPHGPQPVRYFSGERDGLHHHIIAPDFASFVTTYAQLGCAGTDQDDWFRFIPAKQGDERYLDPNSEGARRWSDWLDRDPEDREPDEPPPPVPAKKKADFDLLQASYLGSAFGVGASLAAGAAPDCVDPSEPNRNGFYGITFETAMVLAIRRGDITTAQQLLDAGAVIDTRLVSVSEAIRYSTIDVLRWVIAHGARVNGWRGDRYWPLHVLLTQPTKDRPEGSAGVVPMLEALLTAGADPNARWDGQTTMLMWTFPEAIKVLLEHGADPNLIDHLGDAALHTARSAESVRLLVAHGGDVNALTKPPEGAGGAPHTPYQAHLHTIIPTRYADPVDAILDALLAAGADPKRRDGNGFSSLWYCRTMAHARRNIDFGLDPGERAPNGMTLLHAVVYWSGEDLASRPELIDLFKYYQSLGLDINAAMENGDTALHLAAQRSKPASIALLLKLGADKTIRDKQNLLPLDLAPQLAKEVRELLRV